MVTIKEIINLMDKTLTERYKNMTGDDDALFENVCICVIENTTEKKFENALSTYTKEELADQLTAQITLELEAFGG